MTQSLNKLAEHLQYLLQRSSLVPRPIPVLNFSMLKHQVLFAHTITAQRSKCVASHTRARACRTMEQLLLENVEKWTQPMTLSEIARTLPNSPSSSEVEQGLEDLIKKREIVGKSVTIPADDSSRSTGKETLSLTLYWKEATRRCELTSPVKPSRVLTTPRSGMRPPSLKSRLPFKSPARISDCSAKKSGSLDTSSVSRTPSSVQRSTPRSVHYSSVEQYSKQLARDVEKIKTQLKEIDRNIEELSASGFCEEELKSHIDALHEYNEMKDVGQMLLGKIAEIEGTTTTALYDRFGLNLDN